jgi:hypothetical protein
VIVVFWNLSLFQCSEPEYYYRAGSALILRCGIIPLERLITITLLMIENRVLRIIFGPKRAEVTGGWRKLHNEELHNLYSSPSEIRMSKSRRMRWAGYVTRMGRGGMHIGYWWESWKEGAHKEDHGVCGWTILNSILERMGWYGLD